MGEKREPTTTEEKIEEIEARLLDPTLTDDDIDRLIKIRKILKED